MDKQYAMAFSRKKILMFSFVLALFISFSWLLFGQNSKVLADTSIPIGNVDPLPGSGEVYVDPGAAPTPNPVNHNGWPSLEVGDGPFDGNYLWLKIYVPLNTDATVTIQNGAGRCNNPVNDSVDVSRVDGHVSYILADLDSQESEIAGGGTYFSTLDNFAGGNACGDLSFPTIPKDAASATPGLGPGTQSLITGHSGYRVFLFMAHSLNCPDDQPTCMDANKTFRVFVMPGSSTNYSFSTSGPLVGFSRTTNLSEPTTRPFGISYVSSRITYGRNTDFTYGVQFGTFCSESDTNAPITFANMDSQNFNPQFLSADLWQSEATLPVPAWQHLPDAATVPTWPGNTLGTGRFSVVTKFFDAQPTFNYKLYVNRVNFNNAIQYYVPFDQFDASPVTAQCFQSTCSLIPPSTTTAPVNSPINFSVKMTNNGLDTWQPPSYYLNQNEQQSGSPTGSDSTINFAAGTNVVTNGSYTFNISLTKNAPGTFAYTYSMANSSGLFGGTCSIQLSWSNSDLFPYFKVYNGDVNAGGAYKDSTGFCDPNSLVDPANNGGASDPNSKFYGGIRAYADPVNGASGPKGSSTDYAAYALGLIVGSGTNGDPPNGGVYSDAYNSASTSTNYFSFSNQDVLGGLMGGYSDPNFEAHCTIDYYDSTLDSTTGVKNGNQPQYVLNGKSGQQQFDEGGGTLKVHGTVSGQLSLYVIGDVYIDKDITYNPAGWGFDMSNLSNNAPYFALIVKGNIYIDPDVTTLDGLYVAQPTSSANVDGIFSTCAPNGGEATTSAQVLTDCNTQLIVNGAVAAQHVHLLRSFGSVNTASGNESPYNPAGPNNAAEIFNFTPSSVIGNPDFKAPGSGLGNLNNLPPIF